MVATRPAQFLVLVWTISAASLSNAAEFTGYAVLTSDYVFRGVSYSDGHAAAQLGGPGLLDARQGDEPEAVARAGTMADTRAARLATTAESADRKGQRP